MKNILVPTDFSPNAHVALLMAATLAAKVKGTIILFHNMPVIESSAEEPLWASPDPELQIAYEDKMHHMANAIRLENGFTFEVEVLYQTGSFIPNLNQAVKERNVDLVVMGTKGASNWMERWMGTTTSAYLQQADCPVLVVPKGTEAKMPAFVAYASDFEQDERLFLNRFLQLTNAWQPALTVVHVQTNDQLIVSDEQVKQVIKAACNGMEVTFTQCQGSSVVSCLENFVKENKVDVLAVSLRKRNFVDILFHSSVTDALTMHAHVPLLVLPEKGITQRRADTAQTHSDQKHSDAV